jgi:hypothetical protein
MSRRTAFPLGHDMWKKELSDHQRRLNTVKPTLPAPSAPSGRPSTHSGRRQQTLKRVPSPESATGKHSASPRGLAHAATTSGGQIAAAKGLRVEELSADEQRTCEAMMVILQRLSTTDGKSILEELFVGCEMKRLLSRYTGVYPEPEAVEESDNAGSKKQPAPTQQSETVKEKPCNEPASSSKKKAESPAPGAHNSTANSSYASEPDGSTMSTTNRSAEHDKHPARQAQPPADDAYAEESFET